MIAAESKSARDASPATPPLSPLAQAVRSGLQTGRIPAGMVTVVFGILLAGFLLAEDYRISSVVVEGAQLSDVQAVVAASNLLDAATFRARPSAAADAVAGLPSVASVSVTVEFPGRAVIQIVEHQPVLVTQSEFGFHLVSAEGDVLAEGRETDLPVLHLSTDSIVGEPSLTPVVVEAAVTIQSELGTAYHLRWTALDGFVAETSAGRSILFGQPELIDTKLAVLAAIEGQVADSWASVDLREPSRPALR